MAQTVAKKELSEKEVEGTLVASAPSLMCSLCLQSMEILMGFTLGQGKLAELEISPASASLKVATAHIHESW